MKGNKGITLITLVIYIILALLVVSLLATMVARFKGNINNLNSETIVDTEFDKFNLQMVKETNNEENFITSVNQTRVEFSNGNFYEYNAENKSVYLINSNEGINIKIADKISNLSFLAYPLEEFSEETEKCKAKLVTKVTIDGKQRITEYITNIADIYDSLI